MIFKNLLSKYDIPAPRYTSYPTVPFWTDAPTTDDWIRSLNMALDKATSNWSLYIHIPFCETLCTFCGCNTTITRNHSKESPYVDLVLKEWESYLQKCPALLERPLQHIHLGGGTPTFLSASQLQRLADVFMRNCKIDLKNFEGSIEVDPRRTNEEQLRVLRLLGFTRVSMGVQDFSEDVQRLVNRLQPMSITQKLTEQARALGYTSVNYDLIYGLPKQTTESFTQTIAQTIELRPDRIALYSFALVPWIKPAQRLFKDEDLPVGAEKRALYEMARERLLNAGYFEIGMDHFALKTDSLHAAYKNKTLHRNFMGYTDHHTDVLLGLGVSSISESPDCFHQNEKVLPVYERRVQNSEVPTLRGHRLSQEDCVRREQILKFMTQFRVELESSAQVELVSDRLSELIRDGIVKLEGKELVLTDLGRPFLRNACMALDERLIRNKPETKVFSQAL